LCNSAEARQLDLEIQNSFVLELSDFFQTLENNVLLASPRRMGGKPR